MSFTEIKAEELKDNPFDLCWNYVGQADCDSLYP